MKKQLTQILTNLALASFTLFATQSTTVTASQSKSSQALRSIESVQRHEVATNLYQLLTTLPEELIWIITDYLNCVPDLTTPECLQKIRDLDDRVNKLTRISDKKFAAASKGGTIRIFTLTGQQDTPWAETTKLEYNDEEDVIALDPLNDEELISGTKKGTLSVWGFAQNTIPQSLTNTAGKIVALARLTDTAFACATVPSHAKPSLTLWKRETKDKPFQQSNPILLSVIPTQLAALANNELACGFFDGNINIYQYNATDGSLKYARQLRLQKHDQEQKRRDAMITVLQAGEKPNQLLAASLNGNIRLWDTQANCYINIKPYYKKDQNTRPVGITAGTLLPNDSIVLAAQDNTQIVRYTPYNLVVLHPQKTPSQKASETRAIVKGAHDALITSVILVGKYLVTSSSESGKDASNDGSARIKVWKFPHTETLSEKSGCIIA